MVINTSFPEQQEQDGIIKQSALITKYFLHKKHETFTNKERIWKFNWSGGWRVGSQRSSSRQVSPLIWRNENGGAETPHNLSSCNWPVVEPLLSSLLLAAQCSIVCVGLLCIHYHSRVEMLGRQGATFGKKIRAQGGTGERSIKIKVYDVYKHFDTVHVHVFHYPLAGEYPPSAPPPRKQHRAPWLQYICHTSILCTAANAY